MALASFNEKMKSRWRVVMPQAKSLCLSRKCTCLASVVFVFSVYYVLNSWSWSWYLYSNKGKVVCRIPEGEMQELINLTKDAHYILSSFNLTHFPIYGSLFGAYRYQNPLPWDTDVDLLLRAEELDNIDEDSLLSEFRKKGIEIFYRPWFGAYRITRNRARGDLMIFKNFSGTMNRIGVESYVFYLNYQKHHIFPSKMIESPLPTVKFCGVEMQSPKGGIEFQKYHYHNDWWLEKKPKGCNGADSKP